MEKHAWFGPTMERLMEILKYPDRANEYNSPKMTMDIVRTVIVFLTRYMGENTPAPRIVPDKCGGLRIEIHEYWVDLTMEIISTGDITVILGGDEDYLKSHGMMRNVVHGMLAEKPFIDGIKLLECLRKEGSPNVSAKKSDEGTPQASAPAGGHKDLREKLNSD